MASASELLKLSAQDAKSDPYPQTKDLFTRIKSENDDSLDFDGEEDSNDESVDKDREKKHDPKATEGKPPYSYVAMIGSWSYVWANLINLFDY